MKRTELFPSHLRILSSAGKSLAVILCALFLLSFSGSNPQRVSLTMETKILNKGKVMTILADVYYQVNTGRMVTRYSKPMEYFFISNPKGEARVYYPKSNELLMKQGLEFDTEKTMLYYFFANKVSDLGLKELGFSITGTRFQEGMVITEWKPPSTLMNLYSKVELVHEDYLPIYIAYFDPKGKLGKKIFYYNYDRVENLALPMKVLECVYLSKTDSILHRIAYSNLKTGSAANSPYFNFNIPSNARLVK